SFNLNQGSDESININVTDTTTEIVERYTINNSASLTGGISSPNVQLNISSSFSSSEWNDVYDWDIVWKESGGNIYSLKMESNRVRIHRESDSTLGLFSQVTDSITIPSGATLVLRKLP